MVEALSGRPVGSTRKRHSNAADARNPRRVRLQRPAAKIRLVELIEDGFSIADALVKVGYARKTYEMWRKDDAAFRGKCDQARQLRKPRTVVRGERLGFAEWRAKYLRIPTFWHQQQWVDMLEGREPAGLHESQTYEPANRNKILVNVPPFHAKTQTISVEYVAYRLCMDPSFRVLVISASSELAKTIVYDIQQVLTSPDFLDMQVAYAPEGGWESTADSWSSSQIIFGSAVRAGGQQELHQKDPNVLALGMRSKIYGRRADLIILDDAVDTTNVGEHAKQMKWLRSMVESRLEPRGKLLILGTRVASVDLYSELMRSENYANGRVPWTHLASPAVLVEAEDPADWVTLWPRAGVSFISQADLDAGDTCLCGDVGCATPDGDGLFARWDGVHLDAGPRAANNSTDWALIYQQQSVPEDATFPEYKVTRATNGGRMCGRLEADRVGHPLGGMRDKYVIAGLDPSVKGFAGIVVGAVSRETNKRYMLAAFNLKAPTAEELKAKMREVTEFYGVHEWRVEDTGLLQFFTQDQALRQWFQTRGVKFTPHTTGRNKWDPGFGVSSMASLFGEYDKAWDDPLGGWREIVAPLIELPRVNQSGMKALVHQLLVWTPALDPSKTPCDLVMALWFFEIGARDHLGVGRSGNVLSFSRGNKFQSPRSRQVGVSVSARELRGNM